MCFFERLVERQNALRQALGEARSFDQFEDEGEPAVALLETLDRGDMRMIQAGEHPGFALEARQPLGVLRE